MIKLADIQADAKIINTMSVFVCMSRQLSGLDRPTVQGLRFKQSNPIQIIPGYEGVVENKETDDVARGASRHTGKPTAPALERLREVAGVLF